MLLCVLTLVLRGTKNIMPSTRIDGVNSLLFGRGGYGRRGHYHPKSLGMRWELQILCLFGIVTKLVTLTIYLVPPS